jgi:predicted alpha/beta-fold hydrolase
VIEALRARFSQKKIIAVGFSLGANALLTLMTGQRGVCLPDGALAFNGPVDLLSCSEKLKQGLNRIYDFEFVRLCRKDIQDRQSMGLSKKNYQIPWFYRLQDIDRIYTAEAAGFISAHHYYRTCSTYQHFKSISKPTILITSKDDPFITWEPYLNALANPVIRLHIEEHGGHLGYLTTHSQGFVHERWLRQALRVALSELTFDL